MQYQVQKDGYEQSLNPDSAGKVKSASSIARGRSVKGLSSSPGAKAAPAAARRPTPGYLCRILYVVVHLITTLEGWRHQSPSHQQVMPGGKYNE